MDVLGIIGYAALAYVVLGCGTALTLHQSGLRRIDPSTARTGVVFRTLITPGLIALWPILAIKLARGGGAGPVESPVSARGLRRLHGLLVAAITVLVPIVAGAGILNRNPPHDAWETIEQLPPRSVWKLDETGSEVRAKIPHPLSGPHLVYWTPTETNQSQTRVFLGVIENRGAYSFGLSMPRDDSPGLVVLYAAANGTWQTVLDLQEAS